MTQVTISANLGSGRYRVKHNKRVGNIPFKLQKLTEQIAALEQQQTTLQNNITLLQKQFDLAKERYLDVIGRLSI